MKALLTLVTALSLLAPAAAGAAPQPDAAGGRLLARLPGPAGTDVAFSRDGKLILTAGGDEARVWDAETFKAVTPPLKHKDGTNLFLAALNPDGDRVLTVAGNEVFVWDAVKGERLAVVRHAGPVRSASFSPDGSKLLTAGDDRTSVVWETATGRRVMSRDHPGPVVFAAFSPDGTLAVSQVLGPQEGRRDSGGVVEAWDAASGKRLWSEDSDLWPTPAGGEHFRRWASPFAFTRDGRRLALIHMGVIRLLDPRDGSGSGLLELHPHAPLALALSPDGSFLALACRDGAVTADVAELESAAKASKLPFVTQEFVEYSSKWVGSAQVSSDGSRILWGLADRQVAVSVTRSGPGAPLLELSGHGAELPAVAFSPDGERVAAGFESDGFTGIWQVPPATAP